MHSQPAANDETRRRRHPQAPAFCPMCQSPRVLKKAVLQNVIVCCCDACSAEFVVGPIREPDGT